ncbi:MAG: hypothetical protein ACXV2J_05485 [Actinomycetes bacterium]
MDLTPALAGLAPSLAAAASTQRGAFTGEQARAAGYSAGEIQRLRLLIRRPEQWLSVRRGVYVVKCWYDALPPLDRHRVQVAALNLVLAEPAVASHVSAAVELDLELLDPELDLLHVTRGARAGSRIEAGVHHHAAELPEEHVLRRDGHPAITVAARTAVDLARETARLECGVAVCDSALRLGVPRDELTEMMITCRSWPGARQASRAVSMADGRAANPAESWSRVILTQYGQAPTDIQTAFYDDLGLIGYADFFWEGEQTVGELDGKVKYAVAPDATPEAAARALWLEKVREDRLRALGLQVVRWGVAELYRPRLLVAKVAAARSRGASMLWRSG